MSVTIFWMSTSMASSGELNKPRALAVQDFCQLPNNGCFTGKIFLGVSENSIVKLPVIE